MNKHITASMLYNYVQCPHRVYLDLYGDPDKRDPVSPFVELLWEKGHKFEKEVIESLEVSFEDMSDLSAEEREVETGKAMASGVPLIYRGRIVAGDLVGEPDILRKTGDFYVAGDIKSGAGLEGTEDKNDGRPKKHYAVQLALYTDILQDLGVSEERCPFVWDIHGEEVLYDLDAPRGPRTPTSMWDYYEVCLAKVRIITGRTGKSLPALSSLCKLCHWRSCCLSELEHSDDLSLIPDLGRSKRDALAPFVPTVKELAQLDLSTLLKGKKTKIPGIGIKSLTRFQNRAILQIDTSAQPYVTESLSLPSAKTELFFDIETDPMRGLCYLHGFWERRGGPGGSELFVYFLAKSTAPDEEERAFKEAWEYIKQSRPCAIYYYSSYEKTNWRNLQERYPHVATREEIDGMFDHPDSVDLYYDVVKKKTEWPTRDYSIKTLAKFLGFSWRDTDPSGASSIEWYHRWVETGDSDILNRILKYNEDDCIATRVLLDGLRKLPVRQA